MRTPATLKLEVKGRCCAILALQESTQETCPWLRNGETHVIDLRRVAGLLIIFQAANLAPVSRSTFMWLISSTFGWRSGFPVRGFLDRWITFRFPIVVSDGP